MQDKILKIKGNSTIEVKINTLEWLSRYANFYAPDNVYSMLAVFKEIYSGPNVPLRNAYITS